MEENNINRRDMIRISSLAALSNMLTPARVAASVSLPKLNDFRLKKIHPHSGICFMKAVDLAALLRKKKYPHVKSCRRTSNKLQRINAKVNAIITFVPEDELMAQALAADESLAKGNPPVHCMVCRLRSKT